MDRARAIEVLTQHNKWRRDSSVPNSIPMVNPTELGEAIDFAIGYMLTVTIDENMVKKEDTKEIYCGPGFYEALLKALDNEREGNKVSNTSV